MSNGSRSNRASQDALLDVIQQGQSHIYALVTKHGAIKVGVSRTLSTRKTHMEFGGFDRFLAFTPGDYCREQEIHASLPNELRIAGHREYYYPMHEHLLPIVNEMRAEMNLPALNRRDLPRTGYWARRLPAVDAATSWPRPAAWPALPQTA